MPAPLANDVEARDKIAALTSEVDRLGGLLLSEPLVLVSWPAAADEAGHHRRPGN